MSISLGLFPRNLLRLGGALFEEVCDLVGMQKGGEGFSAEAPPERHSSGRWY